MLKNRGRWLIYRWSADSCMHSFSHTAGKYIGDLENIEFRNFVSPAQPLAYGNNFITEEIHLKLISYREFKTTNFKLSELVLMVMGISLSGGRCFSIDLIW
ncbi:hypothetical protein DID88_002318 [Monilinia fructigena]|uniref:Uncharacterized protein n=1 Tax=Monilinia fructigena TaxID=38457 RepID=A0A395ICX7_9HELO|nr:hypothetical protein DID88_002318 [Monilinia fructigena]